MALSKYIRDLLFRYECVIIPEFGGFITKTISARIDKRSHTFYPPSKRLSFNSQLTENDGLLANHIASVNKISYETAINFINFEVSEWKKNLQNNEVTLEGVGLFSLNNENKIVFEPDSHSNFLTDAFGLNAIIAPTVTREDYMNEEVHFESISDLVNKELDVSKSHKQKLSPFFKFAAGLALLFALSYVLMQQVFKNNDAFKQILVFDSDKETLMNKRIQEATFEINNPLPAITLEVTTENELSTDNKNEFNDKVEDNSTKINKAKVSGKTNTDNKFSKKIEKETLKTPIQPSEKLVGAVNTGKYHIIGGAFRVPANAVKKVKQLKAKGYEAHIVGINKWQLTQVAFKSFTTKEEALKALRKIRRSEEKDAWMLIK